MFKTYQDIFNHRGSQYQKSMELYPHVRQQEFETIIKYAKLFSGATLCDIPSGGGYIRHYIDKSVDLICIETSEGFISTNSEVTKLTSITHCDSLFDIPINNKQADAIISLAGLHHEIDRLPIYKEFKRILKPKGILSLADVSKGSTTDKFLNTFVDQHSSIGHVGYFFGDELIPELNQAGFKLLIDKPIKLDWKFSSFDELKDFFRLLFGIDQASDEEILQGVNNYLVCIKNKSEIIIKWPLRFIQAIKSEAPYKKL